MFDNISISFYNTHENIVKKLNPINVTFLLFLLSICIFFNTDLWIGVFLFSLSIVLGLFCGKSILYFLKTIFHTKFLILSMVFLCVLSKVSTLEMIIYFLKVYSLLFYSRLYLQNVKRSDVEKAFCYFLMPLKYFKMNPTVIAKSISLSICFVSHFYKEAIHIWKSLQNRGVLLEKTSILKKIKWLKMLLVPLLLKTEKTSLLLTDSLIVKGFDGRNEELEIGTFSMVDAVVLLFFLYLLFYIVLRKVGICGI